MEGSSLALTRSLLESKHLVVGNGEVFSTCEERALLSWWALIGAPEIAVSSVIYVKGLNPGVISVIYVGMVWYEQVTPYSKWWSTVVPTVDGIIVISIDERHFGWAQATWVYQAKCEGLAAL